MATAILSPDAPDVTGAAADTAAGATNGALGESGERIASIEAIPFSIPYVKPLKFASGEVRDAAHILIKLTTTSGIVGYAEAPPRPYTYGETQASIKALVEGVFAPQLVGLRITERERAHALMHRTVGNPTAKSSVDMALWDVLGKSLGTSVHDLLGAWSPDMRVSHMLGFADPDVMVAEAQRMIDEHGIRTFKVKVGRNPYRLDVAVCRALRETFGDTIELYVDGNRGWSATDSARAMREMDDLDLLFAEELNPADDVMGRRWLVSQTNVPYIADESATTPGEVTRELLGGSATAVSIKTARTGFTISQRILGQATGLGVEVVMGNQIDGQIGTACTAIFGSAHEATHRRAGELSNFLDMSDDLLTEPLQIRDGLLAAPGGPGKPGLGIDIDQEKLTRYRQDG
ncbi:MAG: enolase C-terminal domain-like protein [Dermatophilus congolensis]|nr:enolase C-terminal domain-like protein [Dermatophilus congolensis]